MRLISALAAVLVVATTGVPSGWTPELFRNAQTLEFYTKTGSGEGHWATVWVVVIEGTPYLRLGSRAALRIDSNADAPYVKIRVAGQEFDRVIAQSAPEMANRVAAAMADKYWADVLIRHFPHQLIVRLLPSPEPSLQH